MSLQRERETGEKPAPKPLTQDIRGSVAGYEARVVPVAHALLQDASAEVLAEAAARRHQAVVAAVSLGKSADDSSGNQSAVRQHRQHHLRTRFPRRTKRPSQQAALARARGRDQAAHDVANAAKQRLNSGQTAAELTGQGSLRSAVNPRG